MTDSTDVEPEASHDDEGEEEQPHGTIAMMVLFGLLIIAMWVWMYVTLLERS
ncbi:MAG TPA: hypothetical protein VMW08_16360 [Acidimicrobiales bacterium]|nr:hypothetical protein [Acidimicrobiales bacterium]